MRARVLVLDLEAENGLVEDLEHLLSLSPDPARPVLHKTVSLLERRTFPSQLQSDIAEFQPDIMLLLTGPHSLDDARSVLKHLGQEASNLRTVIVTGDSEIGGIMDLLSLGAVDYLAAPLKPVDLFPRLWRLAESRSDEEAMTWRLKGSIGLKKIIGRSPNLLSEIGKIPVVSQCDASVLITGETGTGKELCARAVHYLSTRSAYPFVAVNCGALPPELVENELFGHVAGAFTGAQISHPGLVAEARGGTLFLDDIDTLPLQAQVKLLRLLQEKEYRKLGSTKTERADVRVVAATNADLENSVGQGKFRRDLFYRLNVILLKLPPLRERQGDIQLLARHFLEKYSRSLKRNLAGFAPDAMRALLRHDWPGNIRELENVVERAVVFSEGRLVRTDQIELRGSSTDRYDPAEGLREAKTRTVNRFEKEYIEELLRSHDGNISQAAKAAKKNRRAFWELIRKHHVDAVAIKNESSQDS